MSVQELLQNIRESCAKNIWSIGVGLARAKAVSSLTQNSDEHKFSLHLAGKVLTPVVTLWIKEGEWHCTCGGDEDPCEHVAASVIALSQNKFFSSSPNINAEIIDNQISYELTEDGDKLQLIRSVKMIEQGKVNFIKNNIVSFTKDNPQLKVVIGTEDLEIEQIILRKNGASFAPGEWKKLLPLLREKKCTFLLSPIQVSDHEYSFLAVVEEIGGAFALTIKPDPDIRKEFKGGVLLMKDGSLALRSYPQFNQFESQVLKSPYHFGSREKAHILTEVLGQLEKKIPVIRKLPSLKIKQDLKPYLVIKNARTIGGNTLKIEPRIRYGNPCIAELSTDEFTLFGNEVPNRDFVAEEKFKAQLAAIGLGFSQGVELNPLQVLKLRQKTALFEGQIFEGEDYLKYYLSDELAPEYNFDKNGFSICFTSPQDSKTKIDFARVFSLFQSGQSLLELGGDKAGFAQLPTNWMQKYAVLINDMLMSQEQCGLGSKKPGGLLTKLLTLSHQLDGQYAKDLSDYKFLLESVEKYPQVALPQDFSAKLRPYQTLGVNWLAWHQKQGFGALLADDMGLGKTVQTIAVLKKGTLIVAPLSLLHNWQKELGRFYPKLSIHLFHGGQRQWNSEVDVVLTTYGTLRAEPEPFTQNLWEIIVLDEAQAIKNPFSQVAQAIFGLKAQWRLALTGTPLENNLEELWSLFHFLEPFLLGTWQEFTRGQKNLSDKQIMLEVRNKIAPFILRRKKTEVLLDLPPIIEKNLYCELIDAERESYQSIKAANLPEIRRLLGLGQGVLQALEVILRLRQACCHPGLLQNQQPVYTSQKTELLMEWLSESKREGHRALVFSQWTRFLDLVEPRLQDEKLSYLRIDGKTKNRGEIVTRFQEKGEGDVLLLSLKAAGVGLNLTAADHVYILDPWWNPAVEEQALSRAHRIGQDNTVMVFRLIAKDTIEEKILALQAIKKEIFKTVIDGEEGEVSFADSSVAADLLRLIED